MPKYSAIVPNIGGANKKTMNENWAKEATFIAELLSSSCAAADMAKGKITAVPAPIMAKPASAIAGL